MKETLLEGAQQSFTIQDQSVRGKSWHLTIFPDSLHLEATDGETFDLSKSEAFDRVELLKPIVGKMILSVKAQKKLLFRLDSSQQAAIEQWVGPPTQASLAIALKKRFSWGLILGIVFIVGSLPMSGDPDRGIKDIPFDLLSFVLGLVLIALRFAPKLWPRPGLFLVDSIWFLILSLKVTLDIVQGRSSYLWGLVALICLIASHSAFSLYTRFKNVAD